MRLVKTYSAVIPVCSKIAIISSYAGQSSWRRVSSSAPVARWPRPRTFAVVSPNEPVPLSFLYSKRFRCTGSVARGFYFSCRVAGGGLETGCPARHLLHHSLSKDVRSRTGLLLQFSGGEEFPATVNRLGTTGRTFSLYRIPSPGCSGTCMNRLRHANCAPRRRKPGWSQISLTNPGGLADINAIRAACRFAAEALNLEDAIFQGYLHRRDVDPSSRRKKLLPDCWLSSRSRLERNPRCSALKGRNCWLISWVIPPGPAFFRWKLSCSRCGSSFMKCAGSRKISGNVVEEGFWEGLGGKPVPEEPIWLETGLEVRADKLVVHPALYPQTAADLIHLFAVAARRGLRLSNVTRQWIQHHRNVLDTAAGDPQVRRELCGSGADRRCRLAAAEELLQSGPAHRADSGTGFGTRTGAARCLSRLPGG